MARKTVKYRLSEWIDTKTIAETIMERLKRAGIRPTFANCKMAWQSCLKHSLSDAIGHSPVEGET